MKLFDWNHLTEAQTNYFFHLVAALYYSFLGLLIFVMGLVHAVFPFLFGFTPYQIAKKITDSTEKYFLKQ
jgi:hypothetical protein